MAKRTGHWVDRPEPPVWETVVTPCDCCGQVVARRLWIAEVEGVAHRFCGPACEELYRAYVLAER